MSYNGTNLADDHHRYFDRKHLLANLPEHQHSGNCWGQHPPTSDLQVAPESLDGDPGNYRLVVRCLDP